MTRKKKGRKVGSEGPAKYNERTLTKADVVALARKRSAKRKGNKAGTRHSATHEAQRQTQQQTKDPRLGSKKPIPLIVEEKPHPKSNAAKRERRLSAAQELEMLENDAQLHVLLDRLEQGDKLGAGLQAYVDEKLDRIEVLMDQLGLLEEDVEDKSVERSQSNRDEDLLAQFENFKFEQE